MRFTDELGKFTRACSQKKKEKGSSTAQWGKYGVINESKCVACPVAISNRRIDVV